MSKADREIGKRVSQIALKDIWKNSYNLAPASRLFATLCKIIRLVRLGSGLGSSQ